MSAVGSGPLSGLRVLVTRPRHQASELAAALREIGADPVELVLSAIVDPADGGAALARAATGVATYDWVVVTSANGAQCLCARLSGPLGETRVAAVGPATVAELRRWGVEADLVPKRYVSESLVESFPTAPPSGGRVLLARAAVARDVVPEGLRARGWSVDVVEAYRNERVDPSGEALAEARSCEAVAFTSSSAVANLVEAAGLDGVPPVVACIGPVTAATARELGLAVDAEAAEHTVAGLVEALVQWFAANPRPRRAGIDRGASGGERSIGS